MPYLPVITNHQTQAAGSIATPPNAGIVLYGRVDVQSAEVAVSKQAGIAVSRDIHRKQLEKIPQLPVGPDNNSIILPMLWRPRNDPTLLDIDPALTGTLNRYQDALSPTYLRFLPRNNSI